MKTSLKNLSLLMSVLCLFFGECLGALAAERKGLTAEQQEAFLDKRTSGSIIGGFNSYCSLLYAVDDVAIHTESQEINQSRLSSPFPKFYRPTWREKFGTIARQTKSSLKYDAKNDFWVFGAPPEPPGFEITLLNTWEAKDRGLYFGYKPPSAPVGMDIYVMGHYSATNKADEAALFSQVREAIAIQFASNFKKDITVKEMKEVAIGKVTALHYEVKAPTGIMWRQWVVVDSGKAFTIVSAIKPELDKEILPDVLKMVESFRVSAAVQKSEPSGTTTGKPSADPKKSPGKK